jgi:biopolymer transport protein ExbB/TolQ
MVLLNRVASWIVVHWRIWSVPVVVGSIASALMWLSTHRRNKAQRLLAEATRKKLIQDQEIQSFAETIIIWTENEKKIQGKSNLIFSDEMFRRLLRDNADRLHIAMNYLVDKGRAKRATPGYWYIDWKADE